MPVPCTRVMSQINRGDVTMLRQKKTDLGDNGEMCIILYFFRTASLALGQLCDCPSASEAILKNMAKMDYYSNAEWG